MRSSAARVRAAQGKIVNRECCKSETKTFAGQDFSPRVLQVQGLQLCLDGRPVFLDAGRRCAGAPLRSQLFCVSMCLGGGRGGGGRRRVVSLLFRGPPDTRRGAPGSAAWQAQRSRTFMYTYLYMCMRVYTCVHACIHVHVNTSVCRGGSAVHATPPRAPSAPSAVRV